MKKALTFSLMVVIITLIILGLLAFSYIQIKMPAKKEEMQMKSGLEIAKDSLKFIDEMRFPDGTYAHHKGYVACKDDINKICDTVKTQGDFPVLNTWATFMYLHLYIATKDPSYLNDARIEADITMKNAGEEAPYILIPIYEMYKETNEKKYLDFVKENGPKLLENSMEGVIAKSVEAKILSLMFELTNDLNYLNVAKVRILEAEKSLSNITHHHFSIAYSFNDQVVYRPQCFVQIAKLNYYLQRNEKSYLNQVVSFFDKAEVGRFPSLIQALTFLDACVEALMMAYEITGNDSYREQAQSIMQFILNARFDTSSNKIIDGDSSFLFVDNPFRVSKEDINRKYTADAAYSIFLFSKYFKDVKFGVRI